MDVKNLSFLVYGPIGSGLTSVLKAFREFGFITISGISMNAMDSYLMIGEAESRDVAISPAINPYETDSKEVKEVFETLKQRNPHLKLLYISTSSEVLVQRFSATEKQHPYQRYGIQDVIEKEQELYGSLKLLQDYHIDTSSLTESELRFKIAKILGIDAGSQPMIINITSFGFKHGVPLDAEMIFDMRFMPNPFYDEVLRPQTGLDKPVKDYLFNLPEVREFLTNWQNLLVYSLPLYQKQGRSRMTIGIGCTGGQHRSVVMAVQLAELLSITFPDYEINVIHREQHHWPQQQASASTLL